MSSTLASMLADREAERDRLRIELSAAATPEVDIMPHPALLRRYEEKVSNVREALNDPAVRTEAAQTIRSLIRSVTVHVEDGEPVAEVEASTLALIDFAANENDPRRCLSGGRSVAVVAGTRNGLKQNFAVARA